jgi:hypothetical protein
VRKTIFLYIGYGRTGTTFLQEKFFPKLDVNYLGKSEKDYPQWLIDLHYLDDFSFQKEKNRIREVVNQKSVSKNLISSEAFLIAGGWYEQFERIKEIFQDFDVKIIMSFREPIDAMLSFYKYSIKAGDILTSFENSIDFKRTPYACFKRKSIYLPDYYYTEIVDTYFKKFGKENILVLRYEDFKKDKSSYLKYITDFIKVTPIKIDTEIVNSSPKIGETEKLRIENIEDMLKDNFRTEVKLDVKYKSVPEEFMQLLIQKLKGKSLGYY